jgi:hypothetical protein
MMMMMMMMMLMMMMMTTHEWQLPQASKIYYTKHQDPPCPRSHTTSPWRWMQ